MEVPTKKNVLPDSSPTQVTEPVIDAPAPVAAPILEPVIETPLVIIKPEIVPEKMVPLAALEQERVWRKDWEQKYKILEASNIPADPATVVVDDQEEKNVILSGEVKTLIDKIATFERKDALRDLTVEYPLLADKQTEFAEFLKDDENSKISLQKAAKLFLVEQGLLSTPIRKGLEQPVGGGHTPPATGLSVEDIKLLRETQPRKYQRMIQDGTINVNDIR